MQTVSSQQAHYCIFIRQWILPRPQKCPPDNFCPSYAVAGLSNPTFRQKSSPPRGWGITGHDASIDCLMPTPVPGAFIRQWILPRPKKVSTGHFFAPATLWPAFRIPPSAKKDPHPLGGDPFWRREWDSNPRWVAPSPVFKPGSLNRSDISPYGLYDSILPGKCQGN